MSVVIVIITVLPTSVAAGVYVNANGEVPVAAGVNDPAPSEVIVTDVALPENVFPLIVTGAVAQVLPPELLRLRAGGFTQPHDTENVVPVVVHPEAISLTVIAWLPLATPVNAAAVW